MGGRFGRKAKYLAAKGGHNQIQVSVAYHVCDQDGRIGSVPDVEFVRTASTTCTMGGRTGAEGIHENMDTQKDR